MSLLYDTWNPRYGSIYEIVENLENEKWKVKNILFHF